MLIRKISARHLPEIVAHYMRLEPDGRQFRFSGSSSEAALRHRLEQNPPDIALAITDHDGAIRGLVEAYVLPNGRDAEIALSVEPDWRRNGYGRALIERLATLLANRGYRSAALMINLDNHPMRQLFASIGGKIETCGGVANGTLALAPMSFSSLFDEQSADGLIASSDGLRAIDGLRRNLVEAGGLAHDAWHSLLQARHQHAA